MSIFTLLGLIGLCFIGMMIIALYIIDNLEIEKGGSVHEQKYERIKIK